MFRVALVGAGGMASMHANCYANIPNATLVGVMDIRAEAAQALAAKHGAKAFTDFDAMLKELKPDVVDVCCPTPWHCDYVEAACQQAQALGIRGISTEKPMGRTLEECDRMIAASKAAGIPLFVRRSFASFQSSLWPNARSPPARWEPRRACAHVAEAPCRAPGTIGMVILLLAAGVCST